MCILIIVECDQVWQEMYVAGNERENYLRFRKFLRGRMFSWEGVLERGSGDSGASFLTRFGRPALAGTGTLSSSSKIGSGLI